MSPKLCQLIYPNSPHNFNVRSTYLFLWCILFSGILSSKISYADSQLDEIVYDEVDEQKVLFNHSLEDHRELKCTHCHPKSEKANAIRPGVNGHNMCAGQGCHSIYKIEATKDNLSGQVCMTCHRSYTTWGVDKEALFEFPYPPFDRNGRGFCTEFTHAQHLKLSDTPSEQQCINCHRINIETAEVNRPSHGDCTACHRARDGSKINRKFKKAHPLTDCADCHSLRKRKQNALCTEWSKARKYKVGHYFEHKKHRIDIRKGTDVPLSCATCHPNVAKSGTGSKKRKKRRRKKLKLLSSSAMASSCDKCHNGRVKVPGTKRRVFRSEDGKNCKKCHGSKIKFAPNQGHGGW